GQRQEDVVSIDRHCIRRRRSAGGCGDAAKILGRSGRALNNGEGWWKKNDRALSSKEDASASWSSSPPSVPSWWPFPYGSVSSLSSNDPALTFPCGLTFFAGDQRSIAALWSRPHSTADDTPGRFSGWPADAAGRRGS